MSVRAKQKKKKEHDHKIRSLQPNDIIVMTCYLCVSICILELHESGKFTKDEMQEFLEGYFAMFQEVQDKRQTVWGMVRWAESVAGVNLAVMMDKATESMEARKNEH